MTEESLFPTRARINATIDEAVSATELIPDGQAVTVELWKISEPDAKILEEWPTIPDSAVFRVVDSGPSIDGKLINYSLGNRNAGILVKASGGDFGWNEDGYYPSCEKLRFTGVVSLIQKVKKSTGEEQEFNRIKINT